MKLSRVFLLLFPSVLPGAVYAQSFNDVPRTHAAVESVQRLVAANVLTAPGGKFRGSAKLTREELTIALAQLAHSLEARNWDKVPARIQGNKTGPAGWQSRTVNRYDAAVTMDRIAAYVARGLPKKQPKIKNQSEALPPFAKVPAELSRGQVGDALKYLTEHRMVWKKSPLLNPKAAHITGSELAQAMAELVAGLTDQWAEEPDEREVIPPKPGRP